MKTRPGSLLRCLLVLLLLGLLASCSAIRMGYSNADTVIYWWLDGYVDFRSTQKSRVKADIATLLSWHRSTQMPRYVQAITQVQTSLAGNPGAAEVDASIRQIETMTQTMLLKAVPELTDLALSLDEAQLAFLARKFEKNNQAYRKKYLDDTPEQQIKTRTKKTTKQVRDWFGSIGHTQEEIVRQYIVRHPQNYAFWLEESIERQNRTLQVLSQIRQQKPTREQAQAMVRQALISNAERTTHPERRARLDTWNDAAISMMVALIREATPEQKAHAHKKLQGWLEDCQYFMLVK
jgi:Family of unknown function (DUF6279)